MDSTPDTHARTLIEELRQPTRALRSEIPSTWEAFTRLHAEAVADGELPARIKELIALAIAVATQCDGCIAYHARAAARQGASAAEVAEALGVALLMAGGPATVYGPRALEAFRAFAGPDAG